MALASKATTRVTLNRRMFDEIDIAIADGLLATAERVIESANPPDATPFGQGLVQGGGALAWIGKKKVGGTTIGGRQITKPRALRLSPTQITVIGGFGFPGRFQELGTVHQPARPFLTPALLREYPGVADDIRAAVARRVGVGHR